MPSKKGQYLFTSESVSEGHPDKICDQISDAILDEHLRLDHRARVAIETFATTNLVVLGGEVKMPKEKDPKKQKKPLPTARMVEVARRVVKDIGYEQEGFHWKNMQVMSYVHKQSANISGGVDGKDGENLDGPNQGAGDQGIMFGYATNETEAYLPATLHYSHEILRNLKKYREANEKNCILKPDAKSQVTLQYENGKPVRADSLVVSTQHVKAENAEEQKKINARVRDIVMQILHESLPAGWMPNEDKIHINPAGDFTIGGPYADAGLTGRKIIVDTYGGAAPHGGGAFSGKDPSKVDRSAAYAARYLAKNVVAAGLANKCTIQLSYAIGKIHPLSVYVDTDGDNDDEKIENALREVMNLTPYRICEKLKLYNPIYQPTASYGHFGRKPYSQGGLEFFTWEKTDLVDKILAKMK